MPKIKPNPECVKCIGKAQAEHYMTVPHDATTDAICNNCGIWNNPAKSEVNK